MVNLSLLLMGLLQDQLERMLEDFLKYGIPMALILFQLMKSTERMKIYYYHLQAEAQNLDISR